jgi:hypothetical protein
MPTLALTRSRRGVRLFVTCALLAACGDPELQPILAAAPAHDAAAGEPRGDAAPHGKPLPALDAGAPFGIASSDGGDASDLADGYVALGAAGSPCTESHDCASGLGCGYLAAKGCEASGVCAALAPAGGGCAPEPACLCDGATTQDPNACAFVNHDFTTMPIAHPGACVDGG